MGRLLLEKHLQKGVRFLPETKVISIHKVGSGSTIKLSSNDELRTDLVSQRRMLQGQSSVMIATGP